jgi:hypothetical protein
VTALLARSPEIRNTGTIQERKHLGIFPGRMANKHPKNHL